MPTLLDTLIARCRCGVYLSVNAHRDNYASVLEYLEETYASPTIARIPGYVLRAISAHDTIVELQFYPRTPGAFYTVIDCDITRAVECALAILDTEALEAGAAGA